MVRMIKRPLGITVIASVLTCVGGAITVVTLIEAFDALRVMGFQGIAFDQPVSFLGFVLYGIGPVFFYSLGLGLFMSRRWAYALTIKFLPVFSFVLFMNATVNIIRTQQPYFYRVSFLHLLRLRPQMFLGAIFWYGVLMWLLFMYLRLPYIRLYFQSEQA